MMTPERLREIYGPPSERSQFKSIDHLDRHCRAFIAASPFLVMATTDGHNLDVSPKGDPAGFVAVEDDRHLLIPDRAGNRRLDGLTNILANPAVALIFLIPAVSEELRICGTATIHDDPELCARFAVQGKAPKTVTRVRVQEVFLQCGRAAMRGSLWRPESWPQARPVPSLYEMMRDHAAGIDIPDKTQAEIEQTYARTLY